MKRKYDYEKKPSQSTASVQPKATYLQTRGFAPLQTDVDEDATFRPSGYTENFLEKIINQRGTESSDTPVQAKPMNRLKAFQSKRMAIQAKLSIGEPNDKYEQEADATASKVVQQINSTPQDKSVQKQEAMQSEDDELQMKPAISKIQRQEVMEDDELQMKPLSDSIQREEAVEEEEEDIQMKPMLQRREAVGGGDASEELERSIQQAKSSGQLLDPNLQAKMGRAMGADFSGVKVHTDSQSDRLNQSIQAKAFTTGKDVFFRQGAYEPSSKGGQELIAHELTHVLQQNGNSIQTKSQDYISASDHHIQRTYKNDEANAYYSSVLEGQKITSENAVFTATANDHRGGGHSIVYIEYLENDKPADTQVHLTAVKEATTIKINKGHTPRESETKRRSWVRDIKDVEPALRKAEKIANLKPKKRKYRLLGGSLTKGGINCAKFSEQILKAAGIKASAGLLIKTPNALAKGKNKGHINTLDADIENYNLIKKEKERNRLKEEERQRKLYKGMMNFDYGIKEKVKKEENPEDEQWVTNAKEHVYQLTVDLSVQTMKGSLITLPQGTKLMIPGKLDNDFVKLDPGTKYGYCKVKLSELFKAIDKDSPVG
ncbi:DUF4157 domain-containing protein [Pseudanabaena sp. BC1403]|uniref:eCIS core domain-containing protein n=1 Tax=Pseudanabaena sp. BC1403 TaxID=2043171 RepID=UPI002156577A|nr:DUF4157 domain-containing protein [Pseudanabaena sp. BC1403]